MSDSVSALNLGEDLERVRTAPESTRWELARKGPLEVWVTVWPISRPDEKFTAKLAWTEYPSQPPSVKFVDPASGRTDVRSAWPLFPNVRLNEQDICQSWTLEGYNVHPEWRNDLRFKWDPRGNVLLKTIRTLQERLDDGFQGRAN